MTIATLAEKADTMVDMRYGFMAQIIEVPAAGLRDIEVEPSISIRDAELAQPAVERIAGSSLQTGCIDLIPVLGVERTLGVFGRIDPVDDVSAKTVVSIGCQMELTRLLKIVEVLGAETERPCRFGLEVAVAQLIAGIVIEVGESRQTETTIGGEIHLGFRCIFIADIRPTGYVGAVLRTVVTAHANAGSKAIPEESLLCKIIEMEAVLTHFEVEQTKVGKVKIRLIGLLTVGVDGVAEVGRMDIFVSHLQANRGLAYLTGNVHLSGCSRCLRKVEIAIESLGAMPFIAVVIGAIRGLKISRYTFPLMLVAGASEHGAGGIKLVLGAEAVIHARSRIFVLTAHLDIKPAEGSEIIEIENAHVRVLAGYLLFLRRVRRCIAVRLRVFNRQRVLPFVLL